MACGLSSEKAGILDREFGATSRFHLVASLHDALRCLERAAARIFEALARTELRLLADYAISAHLLDAAFTVADVPVTRS